MVRGEELVLREVHGRIDHGLGVREERSTHEGVMGMVEGVKGMLAGKVKGK